MKRYISRIIAVLLCLAMLIMSASCFGGADEEQPTSGETEATPLTVTVTFPEGLCCTEIADLLEKNSVCSADDFLNEVNNRDYISTLPVNIDNPDERAFLCEGYVFPDTYEFYTGSSGAYAIKRFFENFSTRLSGSYKARAEAMGFTLDEIIIIASIIQEEAGNPAEMNKVSSVIHNRLNSPSFPYIQCDVAVKYLMNILKPRFDEDTYYNYCELYNIVSERKGLPAGPITNPGMDAIEAALSPADTDYYYFVTDTDGNYYYANTYEAHRENCRKAGIQGNY